jgi:hypothetical protein
MFTVWQSINKMDERTDFSTEISTEIFLRSFIDVLLDVEGLYTLGHHDPEKFLAIVRQQKPHLKLSVETVQFKWAKPWATFGDNPYFLDVRDSPALETEPITLIWIAY